jgi:hypothetical protein
MPEPLTSAELLALILDAEEADDASEWADWMTAQSLGEVRPPVR